MDQGPHILHDVCDSNGIGLKAAGLAIGGGAGGVDVYGDELDFGLVVNRGA